MFNTRKVIILVSAVMIALFTSCKFNSIEKKSANVVFDFTSISGKTPTASRSALDTIINENEACYIDLKIQGSYEYSQTINLKETQVVQIENIPVGAIITAAVELYIITKNPDDESETKEILYNGESKTYTIISGENNIEVTLHKNAADTVDDQVDDQGHGDENGANGDTPAPVDDTITIYVKYNSEHTSPRYWETDEGSDNDGTTENKAFYYIMSAFKWIRINGDSEKNYEIYLTGYDEENPFRQYIEIAGNLTGSAKSITLTSSNPDIIAIEPFVSPFMEIQDTYSYNPVPIIFKNIKISANSSSETSPYSTIIGTLYEPGNPGNYINCNCNITLGQGTVFLGNNSITSVGGAIHIKGNCSITMEGTATIKDFKARDKGGAVYVESGRFTMKGKSRIENCHVTSASQTLTSGEGGGAFCIANLNSCVTIEENASIVNCSSNYHGGAIFVHQGNVNMTSGSITECSATYGNGGAIYLSTKSSDTAASLYGGTISNNTAGDKGEAIFIAAPDNSMIAKVIMGGNIFIDPESNDIYNDGNPILLASTLTTENLTAALITYDGSKIAPTDLVLKKYDDDADPDPVANSCSKISVRTWDSNTSKYTYWTVDQEGKLAD